MEFWQYRHKWSVRREIFWKPTQRSLCWPQISKNNIKKKITNKYFMSWTQYKPYHTLTIYKHYQYWIQIPSFPVQFPSAFASTSCYLQLSSEDCPWTIVCAHVYTQRDTHTLLCREPEGPTLSFYPSPCPGVPSLQCKKWHSEPLNSCVDSIWSIKEKNCLKLERVEQGCLRK